MNSLKRISYTDDEPDIRTIAQIALEDVGGFELQLYASGQETLLGAPAFNPDLILLDMMMPGMDGIQTFQALRDTPQFFETPVFFMTAKVQGHEVEKYLEIGASGVIPKPFDPMKLGRELQEIWDRDPSRKAAVA